MKEEALKARREYYRQWRKKNPQKLKQYQESYWNKKAGKSLSLQAQTGSDQKGGV